MGTAATSQVVAEALGMTLPHAALAPSGQPIWLDVAKRSARAVVELERTGKAMRDVLHALALWIGSRTSSPERRAKQRPAHRLRKLPCSYCRMLSTSP